MSENNYGSYGNDPQQSQQNQAPAYGQQPANGYGNQPNGNQPTDQQGYGNAPYAAPVYGEQHQVDVKTVPAVKRLLTLTLVSMAVYILGSLVTIIESFTNPALGAGAGSSIMSIVWLAIYTAIYVSVYKMIAKGKKSGLITGTVFASLGILSAVFNLFGLFLIFTFGGLILLLLIPVNIVWLVFAWKKAVTSVMR